MKVGLKSCSLLAKSKLLTIKNQPLSKMPGISAMTKFRAERAPIACLKERLNI
jgi:hypothetical protein